MYSTVMQDVARHRHADMVREAERSRLAAAVSAAGVERPYRRLRVRRRAVALPRFRPAL